ncbi:MAG: SagB/ThcOx family dehydrogenase [Methanophagales archaeon]|nr:SagB/ThcOx family dehydrogenase [Methanophagales archaeon]
MPTKTILIGAIGALVVVTALALSLSLLIPHKPAEPTEPGDLQKIGIGERIKLPEPRYEGETSVEEALARRRSIRAYSGANLTLEEVSQLLWAAQGITAPWKEGTALQAYVTGATAASAGGLYPLEVYLVVGEIEGFDKGVYKYRPENHELEKVKEGDVRKDLAKAALGQECVKDAAINIVFTAVYERTTVKYGERGERYVHMEVGHAAENVYLQTVSLGLGTVVIGAFFDDEIKKVLTAPEKEEPLYIMPVGRRG